MKTESCFRPFSENLGREPFREREEEESVKHKRKCRKKRKAELECKGKGYTQEKVEQRVAHKQAKCPAGKAPKTSFHLLFLRLSVKSGKREEIKVKQKGVNRLFFWHKKRLLLRTVLPFYRKQRRGASVLSIILHKYLLFFLRRLSAEKRGKIGFLCTHRTLSCHIRRNDFPYRHFRKGRRGRFI